MTLSTILAQRPVGSVEQVVGLMTAIDRAAPSSDGVRWFNHLYLRVTLAVRDATNQSEAFADPVFLDRLDVVFANLYFDAVAAGDVDPSGAPPAWRPLLSARSTLGIEPVQYALAGMDAHINRDLPAGIVTAYEQLGGDPTTPDPRHDDFEKVNALLEAVEAEVKAEFATSVVGVVDALTAPADDRVAMWSIRAARDAAWTNAQVLWTLRSTPSLRQDYFDRLDRFTGFSARGLLLPVTAARL